MTEPRTTNRRRVAYFVNCFPNFIEAMIYREVIGLHALGYELMVFSIRRPRPEDVPDEARQLVDGTRYILPIGVFALLKAHVLAVVRYRGRYFRVLWGVLAGDHSSTRDRIRTVCHFAEAVAVLPEVERSGVAHIHAHWAVGATTCAMVVSRFLGIRFSFTAHAYDIWRDRLILPEKLRAATAVVTCTDYNRRHLVETYGVEAGKFRVVHHGLDVRRFQIVSAVDRSEPLILSVGRLVEQKGYEHLIDACAGLRDRGGTFRCEIVGDGPLLRALRARIAGLGLDRVVTLTGRLIGDELVARYAKASIFALFCVEASDGDRDGIPNTLIEAMAMGIPVVSTRYSGVPELVTDGVEGLLVDPGDRVAMVEALERLLIDPSLGDQLGRAGRERVVKDFSVEGAVGKLDQLFRLYLDGGSRHHI